MSKHKQNHTPEPSAKEVEDFWLEIGPSASFAGLESYGTALANGDVSPDGRRLGWEGAEPGTDPADLVAPPDDIPELTPELEALEGLDDVPPMDR